MYDNLTMLQVIAVSQGAYVVCFVLSVVLHELGHAFAARFMGLDLRLISIGHGPALLHRKFRAFSFVLRRIPVSGFVAIAARPGMSRYRYAIMIAGGPGINLVLLGLAFLFDRITPYYDIILMPAMVAQTLLLLLTLIPTKRVSRGGLRASDGMQLWTQLTGKPADIFASQYASVMGLLFTDGTPLSPPSLCAPELIYQIVRSDRLFDDWGLRDAVDAVRALLGPGQLNPAERTLALDFLVSSEVLFGNTGISDAELDAWSNEACTLAPGHFTTLTRAGVLATTGRAKQATDMLIALPAEDRPIVAAFRCSLHMAQAAAAQGWDDTAKQALEAARKAADHKVAQRLVMKRILARAERDAPLRALGSNAAFLYKV